MPRALSVTPPIGLQDEPLGIRLTGFEPSTRIELTAQMTTRDGTLWSSRAAFISDTTGTADAAVLAPVEGSYNNRIDAMGLIWSMERDGTQPTEKHDLPLREPVTITLRAQPADGATLQTNVLRQLAGEGVTFKPLDDTNHRLRGGWWLPAGGGPHPAMIVLGGSGGGADHWRAALYASHGFAALALAYFGAPGLPRGLVNIPLEYVGEAIDYAIDEIRPPGDFCAVEGISRGGELALLVGATFPRARAVIGVMASGLVMGSFGNPEPGETHPDSAWTLGGKPIPNLFDGNPCVDWSQADPAVSLVPGYLAAMRDPASVERATIQVERINGPVLLVSGMDDRLAPRFALAEIARQRLADHHHPWPFTHLSYADTGHTIAPPYIPATDGSFVHPVSKEILALGGTTEGRAHANEDSWPRVLAFLQEAAARR